MSNPKKPQRARKFWTKEEDAIVTEGWGRISLAHMARTLGRSVDAVCARGYGKLGLGPVLMANEEYVPMYEIVRELKSSADAHRLAERYPDLPVKKKYVVSPRKKKIYYLIRMADFWAWLEKHKDALSLAHLEPLALGCEPEWVQQKRITDCMAKQNAPRICPWTTIEDSRLKHLVKMGLDAGEIAKRLNRTIIAVKRRVPRVTYDRLPPVKKKHVWTDAERWHMGELFAQGLTIEQVSEEMGLEREQVVCQMWTLYRTRNADKLRAKIKERGLHGAKDNRNRQAKAG